MKNKINLDEKYVTLGVDIPFGLKDKLKFESYKQGRAIKDLVKEALEKYLESSVPNKK